MTVCHVSLCFIFAALRTKFKLWFQIDRQIVFVADCIVVVFCCVCCTCVSDLSFKLVFFTLGSYFHQLSQLLRQLRLFLLFSFLHCRFQVGDSCFFTKHTRSKLFLCYAQHLYVAKQLPVINFSDVRSGEDEETHANDVEQAV